MFEFASFWALLLLPLPLLLWLMLPKARVHVAAALRVPFFAQMASLITSKARPLSVKTSLSFMALIWVLLIFALAGPRWVGAPEPLTREGYNIFLILDVSGSMAMTDMVSHGHSVTRLSMVKRAASSFVKARYNDKLGLILFGARAYLQTPLTYDKQNILDRIDDATVGLAGNTSSIGDALGLAVKRFKETTAKGRVVILLTDGANNSGVLDPLQAAVLAKDEGIKVHTIGLAPNPNAQMNSMLQGLNVVADLDEKTLELIAEKTDGRYFRASDGASLASIYQSISALEPVTHDAATLRPQHEYYPWPLALALFLFFYWLALNAGLDITRIRRRFLEKLSS